MFNNATTSIDIFRTIKCFIIKKNNLPEEIFLNMCSKDVLTIDEIILFLSQKMNKIYPELIFNKNISTFLIKNNETYNILKNSILLDMFNEILEVI